MTNKRISADNKIRSVEVKGEYIIYTRKADGTKEYLSYDAVLYDILTLSQLSPFRSYGRLQFNVREKGNQTKLSIYDLAYACYAGKVQVESLLDDMHVYYDYKNSHGLVIDHVDSNSHNHTRYNLSWMDSRMNSSKGSIVAYVKMPTYLNSAYCNGKYRVQVLFTVSPEQMNNSVFKGYSNRVVTECSGGLAAIHFLCNTADEYVRCLKWIADQKYEWAAPLKKGTRWIDNPNPCWCLDIKNSLHAQKILASMAEEQFQQFPL